MNYELMSVAQESAEIMYMAASNSAPQLSIEFDDSLVDFARLVSAFAGLFWVGYLLLRNIFPGGRGGGQGFQAMMGQGMSSTKILLAIIGIVCLMDINYLIDISNFLLEQLWGLAEMFQKGDLVK